MLAVAVVLTVVSGLQIVRRGYIDWQRVDTYTRRTANRRDFATAAVPTHDRFVGFWQDRWHDDRSGVARVRGTRCRIATARARRRSCARAGRRCCSTRAAACACAWSRAGVLPVMLDAVLLTHLHSDHICDLNDVVTTQWVMSPVAEDVARSSDRRGTQRGRGRDARDARGPTSSYRLAHHDDLTWEPQLDVTEIEPGCGVRRRRPARHRGARPITGRSSRRSRYRIEYEATRSCSRATPCRAPASTSSAAGADVYVQTVLRDDLVSMVPMQRFRRHRSTTTRPLVQTAQTAARGGVKHARAHAPDPDARAPAPPTSGSRSPASTSPARSCSARTSRKSRPADAALAVICAAWITATNATSSTSCRGAETRGVDPERSGIALRDPARSRQRRAAAAAARRLVTAGVLLPRAGCAARAAGARARRPAHRLPGARTDGSRRTGRPRRLRRAGPERVSRCSSGKPRSCSPTCSRASVPTTGNARSSTTTRHASERSLRWVAVHTEHEVRHHLRDVRGSSRSDSTPTSSAWPLRAGVELGDERRAAPCSATRR